VPQHHGRKWVVEYDAAYWGWDTDVQEIFEERLAIVVAPGADRIALQTFYLGTTDHFSTHPRSSHFAKNRRKRLHFSYIHRKV
jgi:hypothetical protein